MNLSPARNLILVSLAVAVTLWVVFRAMGSEAEYFVTVELRESRAIVSTHNVAVTGADAGPHGSRMIAAAPSGALLFDFAARIENDSDLPILVIEVDTRRPLRVAIRVFSVSCLVNGVSVELENAECTLPRGTHEIRLEVLDAVNGTSRVKSAPTDGP